MIKNYYRCILFLLMIFPFWGNSILKSQDTVTLVNVIPSIKFDLSYFDKWGDRVDIDKFQTITLITTGQFIEILDGSSVYWLQKGNYFIDGLGEDHIPNFSTSDGNSPRQSNETLFFINMYRNNPSLRVSWAKEQKEVEENIILIKSEERYQQKIAYLEQFKQDVSPQFYAVCKKNFLIEYLNECLYFYAGQKTEDLRRHILSYGSIINDDDMIFSSFFRNFCSYYNSLMYPYSDYSQIKNRYKGKVRDYLLYNLVKYTKNEELMETFLQDCKDEEYCYYIHEKLESGKIMKSLKENVLQNDLTQVSFTEMLSNYQGKFIYLDIWASWCTPCRAMIPFTHKNEKKLPQEDVVFVYLSIDEDIMRWKSAEEAEGIDKENSYLISEKSNFIKENQIIGNKGIPYYMIFDRQGKLIVDNAMRPDDRNFIDKMNEIISNSPH